MDNYDKDGYQINEATFIIRLARIGVRKLLSPVKKHTIYMFKIIWGII